MARDTRITGIRRFFRLPTTRQTVEGDVEDEIRFHLEQRIADLIREGMAPAAARESAEREYGDIHRSRAELASIDRQRLSRERRTDWWDELRTDVRHSARSLLRQPGFSLTVVTTLALAIGVNATMFGIIDRLLLKAPAGIRAPEEVHRLYFTRTFSWAGLVTQDGSSFPDFALLR